MTNIGCALRAEAFRFRRNISAIFWGFAFVPLMYIAFGIMLDLAMDRGAAQIPDRIDPILQLTRATGLAGNPLAQLFLAIGAASIFGGDYAHKTWRLLGSRASRTSLLVAKWLVYAGAASAGLFCAMAGSAISMLIIAVVDGSQNLTVAHPVISVATATCGSILELIVFGTFVAIVAIGARSMFAAVIPAFLLSAGQELLVTSAPPPAQASLWLGLPTFAGDIIRQSTLGAGFGAPPTDGAVALAFFSLSSWCLIGIALCNWLFQRQDWSIE